MIVTGKFNTENTTLLENKRIDGLECNIYKFEDGIFCRQIGDTGVYLQTDYNGDVWFTVTTEQIDSIPQKEHMDLLVSLADSLTFEVYDKTFRELHLFTTDTEIKSGFYPVDLTTRDFKSTDLEFEFYCNYFFNAENDNTDIISNSKLTLI